MGAVEHSLEIISVRLIWELSRPLLSVTIAKPVGRIIRSVRGKIKSTHLIRLKKKNNMKTKVESATFVYDANAELVAVVKRDDKSKKVIVYLVSEAKVEEIGKLITNEDLSV